MIRREQYLTTLHWAAATRNRQEDVFDILRDERGLRDAEYRKVERRLKKIMKIQDEIAGIIL